MNKRSTYFFWLVLMVASPMSGLLSAQQVDARQIVQKVYDQAAFRSLQMRASLTIYDREGHPTKKEFLYRRSNTSVGSKTRVDIISAAEEKGVVLLAIQQQGLPANQYVFTPATDRVRSVGAQDRTGRFLGSDFIFDDFADRNPANFTYRLLSESENIDGQNTYKIESRPIERASSPYTYAYLWVSKNAPVIVYAQMYTAPGTLARVLHATDLRRESGVWGMRRTEVTTTVDRTRTVLTVQNVKLNPSLDDAIFASQSLASAVPASKGSR